MSVYKKYSFLYDGPEAEQEEDRNKYFRVVSSKMHKDRLSGITKKVIITAYVTFDRFAQHMTEHVTGSSYETVCRHVVDLHFGHDTLESCEEVTRDDLAPGESAITGFFHGDSLEEQIS